MAIIQIGDAEGKNGEYDNNYVWIFKFKDCLIHSLREYNSDFAFSGLVIMLSRKL